MHPFSEYASFILDRMEPDLLYEPQQLRAFVADISIEHLREIMHELWINRQVERAGDSGWRRHRSAPPHVPCPVTSHKTPVNSWTAVFAMTDEPFYSSSRQPDPPRAPAPGEPVWKLERHGSWVSCELRDDEDAGCEAQLFRDRAFYAGRRFGTRAAALAHADTVRSRLEHEGWTLATPDRP